MDVHVEIHCGKCGTKSYLGPEKQLRAVELAIFQLVIGSDEYEQRKDLGAYVIARSRGWETYQVQVDATKPMDVGQEWRTEDECPDCARRRRERYAAQPLEGATP